MSKGQVIDEALIRSCILEDRSTERDIAGQSAEEEDAKINFDELFTMILSFQSIIRISNLQGFENLTKLQLDNNMIEKIENLDHLVNLTWLDLSFNKITKIENLEKLTNLKDLSLFHNQITKIEGLFTLTKLEILSLGHNKLTALEDITTLRSFRELKVVTMNDNPFSKEEGYSSTIICYLPHLKYLDYSIVTATMIKAAREERHEELLLLEEKEAAIRIEEERGALERNKINDAKEANLEGVETLYKDMIREDPELTKLSLLPGMTDILLSYKESFEELTKDFTAFIFAKHREKLNEQKLASAALSTIKEESEQASKVEIDKYSSLKKKVFIRFDASKSSSNLSNPKANLQINRGGKLLSPIAGSLAPLKPLGPMNLDELNEPLLSLSDVLMEIEMGQSDNTNTILDDLYEALKSIQTSCMMQINSYSQRVFELEKIYFESVSKLSQQLQEKHAAGQLMSTLSETSHINELKTFLEDKEMVLQAIQLSHEKHEELINNMEARISERERTFTDKKVQSLRDTEYLRNRQRISEIFNLIERHKADNAEKLGLAPSKPTVTLSSNNPLTLSTPGVRNSTPGYGED